MFVPVSLYGTHDDPGLGILLPNDRDHVTDEIRIVSNIDISRFIPDLIVMNTILEMRHNKTNIVGIALNFLLALERGSVGAKACSHPQVKHNIHVVGGVFGYDIVDRGRDRFQAEGFETIPIPPKLGQGLDPYPLKPIRGDQFCIAVPLIVFEVNAYVVVWQVLRGLGRQRSLR
jgi:hypothetical protein